MPLHMSMLAALLLCAGASALEQSPQCAEGAENDVSLLQAGVKLQGDLASHRRVKDVPTLVVDLDAAPEVRWRQVTRYWTDLGVYPQLVQSYNITDPATLSLAHVEDLDEEYLRELRGIVADLGLPESYVAALVLANNRYELSGSRDGPRGTLDVHDATFRECSGLLAAMPNGTVVHGRNMDYAGLYVEANGRTLRYPDVTVEVVFMRDGRPLFTSVHWPGEIIIHTAMRFGGWTFERNTRMHFMDSSILYGLFRGSQASGLLARKIMETTPDFETAVQKLKKMNIMAPCYFVVAGAGAYEGAVITMDRGGRHMPNTPRVRRLSSSNTMLEDGKLHAGWHIIQTNDDLDKDPLDERRPDEELKLSLSTQGMVSADWVLGQMYSPPLFNGMTVFTAVFIPATGHHKVLAHYGHDR